MNICPICRREVSIQSPGWSGGLMLVECVCCGPYEIGAKIYDELVGLPESHWQIGRLCEGLENSTGAVKITRASTNIIEVEALDEKLTRMQKWSLRKRAEGESKIAGQIYYDGERNE